MKKFLLVLILLSISTTSVYAKSYVDKQLKQMEKNVKSNSIQIHEKNYTSDAIKIVSPTKIKDPKLIKLSDYEEISEKDYNAKLAQDEKIYKNEIVPALNKKANTVNISPLAIDFYKLYRISEKLIRANNLDYANWLISVRKTEDVNAYAAHINRVTIYTGLYDALYGDDDAMAFVIAHEMGHLILGHQEQDTGMIKYMNKFGRMHGIGSKAIYKVLELKYDKNSRDREYMADAEAIILLTKAGYSPQKALTALNVLDTLQEINTIYDTHPKTKERIAAYQESMALSNPDWVKIGKQNIYNSEVIPVKKSSDHVSIVLFKSEKQKDFYKVEDMQTRLTRIAYTSYLNGSYEDAVKYFEKLLQIDEKDYVPYVYLALSNWELYNSSKEIAYQNMAIKNIEKALELHSSDVVKGIYKQINSNKKTSL